jgi:predicted DNA-binding transcriptional regulator AlpA
MALNRNKVENALIIELEKNYLLQRACKKLGLTRSTVYRWMKDDEAFAMRVRAAQSVGRRNISDFVESKLLKNIEDRNQRAIEYWLKSNNDHYRAPEKDLHGRIKKLTADLAEARTALAAFEQADLSPEFIDKEKYLRYQLDEYLKLGEAMNDGNPNYEQDVLDQANRLLRLFMLAKYANEIGEIPERYEDHPD